MDGNNRTLIVDSDLPYFIYFTLDYKTQMLYWGYSEYFTKLLVVTSSNIDGTIRQKFYQEHSNYLDRFSLDIYVNMLFLTSLEVYKFSTGGGNFTTIINRSQHCYSAHNDLKIVSEEQQPSSKIIMMAINCYKCVTFALDY